MSQKAEQKEYKVGRQGRQTHAHINRKTGRQTNQRQEDKNDKVWELWERRMTLYRMSLVITIYSVPY